MTNNALASTDDRLGIPTTPRLHKSLQNIGMQQDQYPLWGVRMGGSDYAQHNSSGANEENRHLMYDEQIDLTTTPTTKHATPSEPTDSRKADRRTIERPRSDSAMSHPKNCSSVAAKERSPRAAWASPTPSPKTLAYAGVPMRKRPRHGSFPASSLPRKSAEHFSARAASLNRKRHRHTTSDPSSLVPAPLPQDYMAAPANTWLMPQEGFDFPIQQNYQHFCTSTPNNFHGTSETSLTQTGQQVFTGAPYIASSGTLMPGYNVGQPYGVQWSYSLPMNQQVPVTPYYSSGPDVNRHASTYAGVTYQTPATPTFVCHPCTTKPVPY